jgi:Leucine-rich repeat (LRR) protein
MSEARGIILKNASFINSLRKKNSIKDVLKSNDSPTQFIWMKFDKTENLFSKNQASQVGSKSPKSDAKSSASVDPLQNTKIDKAMKSSIVFFDIINTVITDMSFLKATKSFEKLNTMTLSNVAMAEIPKVLYSLPKTLRFLNLSNNYIKEIPAKVKWQNIHGINLSHNRIQKWPDVLKQTCLPELQHLNISWNDLSSGTPENVEFTQLQSIDISYCGLVSFPVFVLASTSLRVLDLSGNSRIDNMTISMIERMIVLRYLNISGVPCIFDDVPKSLTPNLIIAHGYSQSSFPQNPNSTIYM